MVPTIKIGLYEILLYLMKTVSYSPWERGVFVKHTERLH
jgi:hypothetical protein